MVDLNRFDQDSLMKGALAYSTVDNTVNARSNPDSTTDYFTPAMAVKLVDGTQKDILVDEASPGDDVYGFVVYNAKKEEVDKGSVLVVAKAGDFMVMEAAEAITVGQKVRISPNQKVAIDDTVDPIIGIAITKSTADGDLIVVQILTPLVSQN